MNNFKKFCTLLGVLFPLIGIGAPSNVDKIEPGDYSNIKSFVKSIQEDEYYDEYYYFYTPQNYRSEVTIVDTDLWDFLKHSEEHKYTTRKLIEELIYTGRVVEKVRLLISDGRVKLILIWGF